MSLHHYLVYNFPASPLSSIAIKDWVDRFFFWRFIYLFLNHVVVFLEMYNNSLLNFDSVLVRESDWDRQPL
jgi:hypothetical protein